MPRQVDVCNSLLYTLSRRMVRFSDRVSKAPCLRPNRPTVIPVTRLCHRPVAGRRPSHREADIEGIRKFSGTTVKQVMRTRLDVSGIDFNIDFTEVRGQIESLHYSRLPVYRITLMRSPGYAAYERPAAFSGQACRLRTG